MCTVRSPVQRAVFILYILYTCPMDCSQGSFWSCLVHCVPVYTDQTLHCFCYTAGLLCTVGSECTQYNSVQRGHNVLSTTFRHRSPLTLRQCDQSTRAVLPIWCCPVSSVYLALCHSGSSTCVKELRKCP